MKIETNILKYYLRNVYFITGTAYAGKSTMVKMLALINSKKHYEEFLNSGFFTLVREDNDKDTREEVCKKLARHFGLVQHSNIRMEIL